VIAPNGNWLGSEGGAPGLGNSSYALRFGGKPGALAAVFASNKRGNVSLPFGTVLLDPTLIVTLVSTTLPASGRATLGLPIPGSAALVGQILPMQAAVVDLALATITLSRGVEVTVQ